jgi:D-arabinose 1-dehydrogenase-like Zn-dependent alcohol dehydrogenase
MQLSAFPLVFGGRAIYGSLTGTPIDNEDTLAFSVLENIRRGSRQFLSSRLPTLTLA